jgi:hypothetical protein
MPNAMPERTKPIAGDDPPRQPGGAGLVRTVRAREWWEYKFVPILTLFYATAFLLDASVASLWRGLGILLLSLIPGAAYVSLVNDATDIGEDEAAGKANRLAGRSRAFIGLALACAIAGGLAFAWLWRDDPLLLGAYLAAWIAYSLYSLPPFRLKARGLAGLVADAAGANLFPSLVAMILAFRAAGAPLDTVWLATAGAWALAFGLRGIIWHQLLDSENDRAAGVRTFVQRHSRATVARIGEYLIFPVEIAALAAMLWQLGSAAPLVALAAYAWLVARRLRVFVMPLVIVAPRPRHMILLQDYYDLFLPLALLLGSALRFPIDLLVLAGHLLLFPRRALQVARDAWTLRGF